MTFLARCLGWIFASGLLMGQVSAQPLVVEVLPVVQTAQVPRIGLNLGDWNAWGAGQLMRNVLKNKGFEGVIDRTIVVIAHADSHGFDDDMSWSGRPDGFWAGAKFDVRSGASAGQTGSLVDSQKKGLNGLPTFTTQDPAPPLAAEDVVVLTRIDDTGPPKQWVIPRDALPGQVVPVLDDTRPGSPGRRAVALVPNPAAPKTQLTSARVIAYLDSIGDRAGKLLPVNGRWRLALWARSEGGKGRLRVSFQRAGSPAFLKQTVAVPAVWKRMVFEFNAMDSGPPGTLALDLGAEEAKLVLDDVSLEAVGPEQAGGFRPEVLAALAKLKPGYLRDWQGQLGDTFENRIAAPFAARASRYRPGEDDRFSYGLPAFLDLAKQVGANPWVVLPTTFSDAEYVAAGRYLAGRISADGFSEMVVEFGNENWNAMFRSAGLPNPKSHGLVAERAFARLRLGAGPNAPIRLAVNGQEVVPSFALRYLDSTPSADLLAVAPYLLYQANLKDIAQWPWSLLFKPDTDLPITAAGVAKRGKELASYEVNLHATGGDVPADLREQLVTGAASGSGLGKRLLESLAAGVKRQCVYNLAQYDFLMADRTAVKLWGVVRDLGPSQRLRPTGLAMALLNEVLPGDIHQAKISGDGADTLTATAIRRADGWALALVSSAAEAQSVRVLLPDTAAAPRRLKRLEAASPAASNESSEQVRRVEENLPSGQPLTVTVPAFGMVVLTP